MKGESEEVCVVWFEKGNEGKWFRSQDIDSIVV